jgi:excisionase family DNA binding protein
MIGKLKKGSSFGGCIRYVTGKDEAKIIASDGVLLGTNAEMNYRPMLGGERFMTDKELCARLQLSRRTLQDYRNNGVIPYIQLGGKILYRESDIQKILMANYREAYRMKGV